MLNRILHKIKTSNVGMIYSIICFLVFEMTLVPHLSAQVKWKNVSNINDIQNDYLFNRIF